MSAQTWDPARYEKNARFVSDLGQPVVDLLAPRPGDVIEWLETFGESFTSALPTDARAEYLREVRDDLEPKLRDASGTWVADYVRLRFAATKPGTQP
jgi:hypothetical protein